MTIFVTSTLAEIFIQQYGNKYEEFKAKVLEPSINSISENEYIDDKTQVIIANTFLIAVTRVPVDVVDGIKVYNHVLETPATALKRTH